MSDRVQLLSGCPVPGSQPLSYLPVLLESAPAASASPCRVLPSRVETHGKSGPLLPNAHAATAKIHQVAMLEVPELEGALLEHFLCVHDLTALNELLGKAE